MGVLDSSIAAGKAALGNGLKIAGLGVAIAVAALVALFFFSLAAFIGIMDSQGVVTACVSLGVFYAVVTVAVLIAAMVFRNRRVAEPPPPPAAANWWADPAIIATGVELVRIVGIRRIVPAVAVGIALLAALQKRPKG